MRLEASARTDPGPVRENNEDNFHVDVDQGLFVVADGMGGHASGEVASEIAVSTVVDLLLEEDDPDETRLSVAAGSDVERVRERIRYTMNQASQRIRRESLANPVHSGMGTTLVVLLIEGGQAYLGHVGDSRAYLFRDGRIERLTRDHTVVQQEIDAGRLTPELARIVPHKNILTQSVGYHGPVEPDTLAQAVRPNDIFLLCSDGLTDPLDDEHLERIIASTPLDDLAEVLVQKAIEHGTEDNVTVVVVGVSAT
jgi:serine/threonine protein phosphatase PrpC